MAEQMAGLGLVLRRTELNAALCRPGRRGEKGKTSGKAFSLIEDYDEEADWSFPLADRSHQQDQQKFPRDPEHIPAWLAPKLGLGATAN